MSRQRSRKLDVISENTESGPATQFTYQALQAEDKIGTMLPCVSFRSFRRKVEVAAIDPLHP
jgi:hypothetical protein